MISSITIQGFQCHEDLHLKLDKHITVLVGSNYAGKSAVVRALKWWALNKWDGKADQMRSWDKEQCTVTGKVDKDVITRRKDNGENVYVLNDGKPLEAVGAGKVPAPIASIINMDENNFQEQLDPAFWFHLTAGQVAKSLNKIVNLSAIDSSLERVGAELRQAREQIRDTEQRITEATNIKISLQWVKTADSKLKELEEAEREIDSYTGKINALATLLAQAEGGVAFQQSARIAMVGVQAVIQAGDNYFVRLAEAEAIKTLIDQVEAQEKHQCDLKAKLVALEAKMQAVKEFRCRTCGQVMSK